MQFLGREVPLLGYGVPLRGRSDDLTNGERHPD